ncbi:hypothetical protein K440DRAFT_575724, partial [Wilcoxina mikolae CBS 423.85]
MCRYFVAGLKTLALACIVAGSGVAADSGDDATNNLFSDLAPLLALFGEQFAKQYLSESFVYLDHIIFAMAPLGILTAIVAAIRIGGPSWLRSVVGRARENLAAAEIELMSSTSHEVGELWNGLSLVRTIGRPQIKQLLYLKECYNGTEFGLYTLEIAEEMGFVEKGDEEQGGKHLEPDTSSTATSEEPESAPNVSLNLHGGSNIEELYFAAACGILLQFGVLTFSGLSVYYPQWNERFRKNGEPVRTYAFVLFALGTIILVWGVIMCSMVIERSTEETRWVAGQSYSRCIWLQKSHVCSDQTFNSFILSPREESSQILTSRRCGNYLDATAPTGGWLQNISSSYTNTFTVLGTVTGLVGFILQFQGLRGLNWSSSIAQLAATAIMTLLRAWIRRGLTVRPAATQVLEDHEMDWLALRLAKGRDFWLTDDTLCTSVSDPTE